MKIVVSADASTEGAAAREWCRTHAGPGDETIVVVGVDTFSEVMLTMSPLMSMIDERQVRADTQRLYDTDQIDGIWTTARVVNDTQSKAVLTVAEAEGADLIVVGKRGHSAIADMFHNETALHLIHHPPCPVVVVPAA